MLSPDNFQYAIENTRVVRSPQRRIATFGSTSFRFLLVTELMDAAHQCRVRDGQLHAERPQILTPDYLHRSLLEGFGERAEEFMHWLQENKRDLAILKYGFQFRKTGVSESIVHRPVEDVLGELGEGLDGSDDSVSAIIHGVDEGWEVCLLKFASDMIQESAGGNIADFRKRGLF